ncbi:unnamed protein product [Protopolystoma xenopodis]|uniref:Uncharacterized protein n=1 Tax=Protopolystoma xenopodis TaxID=117903 RepID=A0A448XCZ6_9PLAT|nr:unnamed protein product [Protopolystoma xenopodis]
MVPFQETEISSVSVLVWPEEKCRASVHLSPKLQPQRGTALASLPRCPRILSGLDIRPGCLRLFTQVLSHAPLRYHAHLANSCILLASQPWPISVSLSPSLLTDCITAGWAGLSEMGREGGSGRVHRLEATRSKSIRAWWRFNGPGTEVSVALFPVANVLVLEATYWRDCVIPWLDLQPRPSCSPRGVGVRLVPIAGRDNRAIPVGRLGLTTSKSGSSSKPDHTPDVVRSECAYSSYAAGWRQVEWQMSLG